MGVRLNGSTSGYVELNAPAVAGTTTLELPTDSIKPGLVLVTTQSFTTAATVSVNNCFTSTYDNYLVSFTAVGSTTPVGVQARFRSGGTDNATANYYQQLLISDGSTTSAARTSTATSVVVGAVSTGTGWSAIDVLSPALAAQTLILSRIGYAVAAPVQQSVSGSHNVASAFDGITLFPTSGTFTGSLYVYGYRKAV